MATNIIWLVAVTLEIAILFRGLLGGMLRKYPYFFSYLGFVLVQDFLRMSIYAHYPELYPQVYWSTQFLGLLFGWGLLWEIYRQALAPFPGAERVARYAFGLIALLLLLKTVLGVGHTRLNWAIATTVDLERDLRFVQAVALSALLAVFVFYGLPLGRNLLCLVLGYGVFVATSVINLAVRARFGDGFQHWWLYLQPSLYVIVLCIWCAGLWNCSVMRTPAGALRMAEDYARLANSTRTRLNALRSHMNRGIRA